MMGYHQFSRWDTTYYHDYGYMHASRYSYRSRWGDGYASRSRSFKEICIAWWAYLDKILVGATHPLSSLPGPFVRRRPIIRINHEKQYPRIVRCRNNRNP